MKCDLETEEDAEVAQYLNTAVEVQPGLNWRLVALRRQASLRNGGGNSYANCSASPKNSVSTYQRPGSSTLGTNQTDLDSQYVRKRLEREQKQRQSQQRLRPKDKRTPNEQPALTNGDSGTQDNASFQDLRTPRRSYSFRETTQRRASSAVTNGQSGMLPGEKSALQIRRVNGVATAKPDATTSTLQRRLTYDPLSSKVISRPMKPSTDKGSPAVQSSPEVKPKQNQVSKEVVPFRRTATCRIPNNGGIRPPSASASASPSTPSPATAPAPTNGLPAVNGQASTRKEPRPRMASPTPKRLSMLSPPPPPIRGLQNGMRSRLASTPKNPQRTSKRQANKSLIPAIASSSFPSGPRVHLRSDPSPIRVSTSATGAEQSRSQLNEQADPLRQSQREKTDKPPDQNSPQRMDSETPNNKENQIQKRIVNVYSSPIRGPTPATNAQQNRSQVNGQADPLRQSRREKTDKLPGQNSLQRMGSQTPISKEKQIPVQNSFRRMGPQTPSSKEKQIPQMVVDVNSHYPDMAVESINVKLERLTTHVLELRKRVERDYAESGSCSPGDDIYGDEEIGAIRSGRPTGMHPVVASSLKNIRVLEANIQEIFDLLYPNEVEIWSPQQTRRMSTF